MARFAVPSRRTITLLLVTAVALMTIDSREFGPFQSARRFTLAVSQPLRDGVGWATSPVVDAWNGAVHYDSLRGENDELRSRIAELEGQVERLPDTEAELENLLEATDLEFAGQIPRVTGRVVADRRTGLERIVEIDRGSDDGVNEGMPVVTGQGLVGRVMLVTGDRSAVRLITDPRFSVGIVDPKTGAVGLAIGGGENRELVVDLQEASLDLAETGDRFRTSGFDRSRYPGGIPVGELVVDEGRDLRALQPFADLDRLTFLTILLVPEP